MKVISSSNLIKLLKLSLFTILLSMTFSANAARVVWVPGHWYYGHWVNGHYRTVYGDGWRYHHYRHWHHWHRW